MAGLPGPDTPPTPYRLGMQPYDSPEEAAFRAEDERHGHVLGAGGIDAREDQGVGGIELER
jgi:hypothetical protein